MNKTRLAELDRIANSGNPAAVGISQTAIREMGVRRHRAQQRVESEQEARAFANGGAIEPDAVNLDALRSGTVDPLGSDFDSINAEKTLRWAQEDAAKRASYGQAPQTSMAATDLIKGLLGRAPVAQPAAQPAVQPIAPVPKASKGFTGMTQGEGDLLKNFDTRQNSFENGGKPETAEQLLARMAATYGVSAAPETKEAPRQQPPAQPAKQPGGLIQQAVGLLGNRHKQIEKAAGYANGGKIKGPGTATSDSIPATTGTGENIRVANGERIVSVAQDQALQRIAEMLGFETVDAMFESMTGKPVGPTMKGGQIAAEGGMNPEDQFGQASAASSLSPMNGQTTRAGSYPSKLQQAITGAKVVPAAPNVSRGDVGPSVVQRQVSAEIDQLRGPAAEPVPLGNEGRSVPHPVSIPASRPGANILAAINASESSLQGRQTKHMENNNLREFRDAGAGITTQRGANGRLSITNVGTEGITDPTNRGLDDSAAAAARHADDVKNGRTPQQTYERMVRNRLLSDATSDQITDPNVRQQAIQGLAIMNATQSGQTQAKSADMQQQIGQQQLDSHKQLAEIQQRLLDPNATPEQQAQAGKLLQMLSGRIEKPANLQTVDVEEPIDPNQPLLGNKKIPHVFDPRTGQSRPMLQNSQPQSDPMAQARAAIARGADPKAVNARLKALGHPEIK